MWLLDIRACSPAASFFYAHIGFPLMDFPADLCPFLVCDTRRAQWFTIYEAIRELISRVFPFFLVAYMNARILVTYRNTKKDRMQRMSVSQKRFLFEKSEKVRSESFNG
ncbi:hypothetical protein TELCIR_09835 [Teladorsagia circumcincta]|uniref:Uncharacterized protein n=1 Tax=Teladorsagia circumcincta TaxID=45464 RepID=A0A2G9UDU4_TELCI|nr:hypothetical protein TELCIR_09835 [Teladorsagia circumcincta]